MAFDDVVAATMRLVTQAEALGALAARLRLATDGGDGDATVTPLLDRVVSGLGLELDALTPAQRQQIAATARTFLVQALELVDAPARAPGWVHDDPALLQAQGAASGIWASLVEQIAPAPHGLRERLATEGARFLDVGSGVARLAIGACSAWPQVSVVGLEPWPPSMALARSNVAAAGLETRIELRQSGVEALTDEHAFDLAWLAGPFLPRSILAGACVATHRAMRPGGWTVFGLYASPADPMARAITDLRVVRSGGALLSADEAGSLLRDAGFVDVHLVERRWSAPMDFVIGRRA